MRRLTTLVSRHSLIAKLQRRMDKFRIRYPRARARSRRPRHANGRSHPLEKDIDMGALVDKSQYDSISGQRPASACRLRQSNPMQASWSALVLKALLFTRQANTHLPASQFALPLAVWLNACLGG